VVVGRGRREMVEVVLARESPRVMGMEGLLVQQRA
jgi:hypothetical protein